MTLLNRRLVSIFILIIAILIGGNFFASLSTKHSADASVLNNDTGISTALSHEIDSLPLPHVVYAKRSDIPPKIYSRSYALLDGDTKYLLASKDPDKQVPIASTTKLMTSIVSLETLQLDQVVTVSSKAATIEGSDMHLLTGEKITVKNLLYGLMLNSGNDAARALSEAGGSTDEFVGKMNAKATLLGLRNTHYEDPAGLNDHSMSSPRDLAILLDYNLRNKTFKSIVQTKQETITSADGRYVHELKNSNRLIQPDEPLYLPASIGGKTGFTYEAGHCLVAAAEANGKRYVAAVLFTTEDTKEASAKEARKLLNWAIQSNP